MALGYIRVCMVWSCLFHGASPFDCKSRCGNSGHTLHNHLERSVDIISLSTITICKLSTPGSKSFSVSFVLSSQIQIFFWLLISDIETKRQNKIGKQRGKRGRKNLRLFHQGKTELSHDVYAKINLNSIVIVIEVDNYCQQHPSVSLFSCPWQHVHYQQTSVVNPV